MPQVTIQSFAKQIKTSVDKLLGQLADAGIKGKDKSSSLTDEEKKQLLQFLKSGGASGDASREQITLKRKTTDEIKQTSRTGAARTVHVEVKKRRTFVTRKSLETEQMEKEQAEAAKAAQQKADAEEASKKK